MSWNVWSVIGAIAGAVVIQTRLTAWLLSRYMAQLEARLKDVEEFIRNQQSRVHSVELDVERLRGELNVLKARVKSRDQTHIS